MRGKHQFAKVNAFRSRVVHDGRSPQQSVLPTRKNGSTVRSIANTLFSNVLGALLAAGAVAVVSVSAGRIRDSVVGNRLNARSTVYHEQLEKLGETKRSLENLIRFLEQQKKDLSETQRGLTYLESERARLQPLVEADRKTIDALFTAQEQRNVARQRSERWFGFLMGVVSSLIASAVWFGTTKLLKSGSRETSSVPKPEQRGEGE
jgi:hypothetical protein